MGIIINNYVVFKLYIDIKIPQVLCTMHRCRIQKSSVPLASTCSCGKMLFQGVWRRQESVRARGDLSSNLVLTATVLLRDILETVLIAPHYRCAPEHRGFAEGSPSTNDNKDSNQWWMVSASVQSSVTALCLHGCSCVLTTLGRTQGIWALSSSGSTLCQVMIKWSGSTFSEPCWLPRATIWSLDSWISPCPYPC